MICILKEEINRIQNDVGECRLIELISLINSKILEHLLLTSAVIEKFPAQHTPVHTHTHTQSIV